MKTKYNYFYVRVQEKKICVTDRIMDTSKCRKDIYPSSFYASKNLVKKLENGYEKINAREFRKLLI